MAISGALPGGRGKFIAYLVWKGQRRPNFRVCELCIGLYYPFEQCPHVGADREKYCALIGLVGPGGQAGFCRLQRFLSRYITPGEGHFRSDERRLSEVTGASRGDKKLWAAWWTLLWRSFLEGK
jgi:hypothetical protein